MTYELLSSDGAARRGRVHTTRGSYETPVFMPVGTRGAVVHLDARDYESLGAEVVLGNTYHLMLRPGADVIEGFGGLHGFTSWDGHMLTDSGGFQVMSLSPEIDDDGVTFTSVYDGSKARLTPESATHVQEQLGADIAMVLDICPALPATPREVRQAMETTHRWAERAHAAHTRSDQAQFGIVQGGVDPEMRIESARVLADIGFPGYGIGGLSVGEPRGQMLPALEAALSELPSDVPRYLMGVGDPVSIVEAIALGVDMFDCVLPTRLARHGTVLTSRGRVNLRNAKFERVGDPLDERNPFSNNFAAGYLRHLLKVKEPTAGRILTQHNIWYLFDLVARTRRAIDAGTLQQVRDEVAECWD
ncbi:MAG: tRNA guanosine(34) transglycosylase Tgt [Actinomycetia bacterium]|nr:tRNA guanosine(34) transglycosylase Tgt [Actinomycetes bacterium]MCP4958869.1 tRNA guanosine(34) transglycosylase Tgt [Actinomycetes bacterium]